MGFERGCGMIDYSGLNPEQYEAIMNDHPRILTLAGAGTGKTRVLTHRIARLWEAGTNPENMLALTFTRAAGAEMKERVIELIGSNGKKLFCNTFHSFCVEVIRENAERLGYEPNFSVYSQIEADDLLDEVLNDLKFKTPAKKIAEIRAGKTNGILALVRKEAERSIKEYEYRLRRNNALDFDGLISTIKDALQDHEIRDSLRERYKYVFIDEFQDTDSDQWEIIQNIAPDNLFVVGDDFQSIYAFRGSDISIILGLADSRHWKTIKLERNYRSTLPIIVAANNLIKHNQQTDKKLVTDKAGPQIEYREPQDDETEITDIITRLESNQRLGQKKTTAILARTNRQIHLAKTILASHGVPHETASASDNPLTGKGARELLAWIAAIVNPRDDSAMRKIAASKMSKLALLAIERRQSSSGVTFTEALSAADEGRDFLNLYETQIERFMTAADVVSGTLRLKTDLGINDEGAIYAITNWQQRQIDIGESATSAELIEYVKQINAIERPAKKCDADKTWLMTVHGSKGLEFDEVFIIGATQGTFPSKGDIEEERRIFYVAMTRAREYLNISSPLTMKDWDGDLIPTEKSQFVEEMMASTVLRG